MEKYLLKKEALKTEIEQVKAEKKTIPRKIAYSELPEVEKFDNVLNEKKHFLDTIKIIAYRAETALSNIIKQDMSIRACKCAKYALAFDAQPLLA